MADAWLVVLKFLLGSGGLVSIAYWVYTLIRKQATDTEKLKGQIEDLESDRDEMKTLLNKMNDRFDIVATRLGEITGVQKDQAKDMAFSQDRIKRLEDAITRFFDKMDNVLNVVTEMRIELKDKQNRT